MPRLAGFAVTSADAVVLTLSRPRFADALAVLSHPNAAVSRAGADEALLPILTSLIWLIAAWLGAGLLAAAISRLPGLAGRAGALVTRLLLPRAVRALLAGSAGFGVLLAPVAAVAAPSPHPTPSPAWPLQASTAAPSPAPPLWPATPSSSHRGPAPVRQPSSAAPAGAVTIRPGDSLWAIAAARLEPGATPARVAAEWPRWFAANRVVIGDDPDLIRPGQVLRPPAHVIDEARP